MKRRHDFRKKGGPERRRRFRTRKVKNILSGGKTWRVMLEIREVQENKCWGCPWTFSRDA